VATGSLDGDILTCPWHGFQYSIVDGRCLADPSAQLDMYPVVIEKDEVYLELPIPGAASHDGKGKEGAATEMATALHPNEFRTGDIAVGKIGRVQVNGADVAVYNVDGTFYATQNECTHAGGELSEGDLDGTCVTCFLHESRFDVTTGAVLEGPADEPLKVYRVVVDGERGRVEPGR
jgi:nitrite reductase/ring-hydroxylating ferredoxin subunit